MNSKAKFYINKLGLTEHPEGGYYREIYRSEELIGKRELPDRYSTERSFATLIFFLLEGENKSHFHRLQSDEIWYFHDGSPVEIYIISGSNRLEKVKLGKNLEEGENLNFVIKKNSWFAAEVQNKSSFALISCSVSPGFDFDDFKLAKKSKLLKEFPEHKEIIEKFSKV